MARAIPIHKLARPDAPLRASAPVVLVRLEELLDYADALRDPGRVEELHAMRIAAKRLRYTLEIFHPTLAPDAGVLLAQVEEIQERLGKIHDHDVLVPQLERTLEREMEREKKRMLKGAPEAPFLAAEGLVPLIGRLRAEREQMHAAFVAFWDGLPPDTFSDRLTRLVSGDDTILGVAPS
jgi:hypothetical protein